MRSIHDPDGTRLPVKLDSTSNGEYEPIALDAGARLANEMAQHAAGENARRLGRTRRDFLVSTCGVASTLLAFNAAQAAVGRTGGWFALAEGVIAQDAVMVADGHAPLATPAAAELQVTLDTARRGPMSPRQM